MSETEEPTSRKTNQGVPGGIHSTRDELLATGLELILEQGLPLGIHVKVADVVARAGRSLGSAYQIWPNQQAFREDLALALANYRKAYTTDVLGTVISTSIERGDSLRETALEAGPIVFESFITDSPFYVARHFWTIASPLPEEIRAACTNTILHVREDFESLCAALLSLHGMQPIAPYDLTLLTRMIIAMVQGLALEARFPADGETSETYNELFVDALHVLIDSCLEPVPTEET